MISEGENQVTVETKRAGTRIDPEGHRRDRANPIALQLDLTEPCMVAYGRCAPNTAKATSLPLHLQEIVHRLTARRQEDEARATLDMHDNLRERYQDQWKEAAHMPSGYWKIMHNIFHDSDFMAVERLRTRFRDAGFKGAVEASQRSADLR